MRTRPDPDRAGAGPGRRHAAWPMPVTPAVAARALYRLHRLLEPRAGYRLLAAWLERHAVARRWFTAAEERVKGAVFGCRMCGQCALPATGYACPMSCPKQLRNGPCGGVSPTGECEVHPGVRCVWLVAYERAEAQGRAADLQLLQRPIDHRQWSSSSWINYWQGRDEGMWTSVVDLPSPSVHRPDSARPR